MKILDFSLLRCPVPLVQTKLFVKNAKGDAKFQIILSDRGSIQDVPAILKKMGHQVETEVIAKKNVVLVTVKLNSLRNTLC